MKLAGSIVLALVLAATLGCERPSVDAPPSVRLDDSVCAQCNMIISDERWATATMIEGPRGPEARLFDDFNCQVNYEGSNPDSVIVARWSHSYATRAWLSTEDAHFLVASGLFAPMGSGMAAFASREEAETARKDHPGDILTFDAAWERLGSGG